MIEETRLTTGYKGSKLLLVSPNTLEGEVIKVRKKVVASQVILLI